MSLIAIRATLLRLASWIGYQPDWSGFSLTECAYDLARWHLAPDEDRRKPMKRCDDPATLAYALLVIHHVGDPLGFTVTHEWTDEEFDELAAMWREGHLVAPDSDVDDIESPWLLRPKLLGTPSLMPACDAACAFVAVDPMSVCELPYRERIVPGWTGIRQPPRRAA